MRNIKRFGQSCSLTINKSRRIVCPASYNSRRYTRLITAGIDPVVEDFELLRAFQDTAFNMQYPLLQIGVPLCAIPYTLDSMAKHLCRIISRHGVKLETHSRLEKLDATADISAEVAESHLGSGPSNDDTLVGETAFLESNWSSLDLTLISPETPEEISSLHLADNLGTLDPTTAAPADFIESADPGAALCSSNGRAREIPPTRSINPNDLVNTETDAGPSGASSETRPYCPRESNSSSPRISNSMPIDPGFGK